MCVYLSKLFPYFNDQWPTTYLQIIVCAFYYKCNFLFYFVNGTTCYSLLFSNSTYLFKHK